MSGRWLEAGILPPDTVVDFFFFGIFEMPGGWRIVSVQAIYCTKALRSKSMGLIYFVDFAEEIMLPWTESSED